MSASFRRLLVPAILGATVALWAADLAPAANQSPATTGEDLILGTWNLDVAKSKYSPGPAPKSERRTYEGHRDGLKATITRIEADGHSTVIQYTADYNSMEYPVSGSSEVDTIALRRVDAYTAEATLTHAGKELGSVRRVVSKDGKTLTISIQWTDSRGGFNNVAVYDKELK
jgi:hypothetical protein